jgi:hypothetical protein
MDILDLNIGDSEVSVIITNLWKLSESKSYVVRVSQLI